MLFQPPRTQASTFWEVVTREPSYNTEIQQVLVDLSHVLEYLDLKHENDMIHNSNLISYDSIHPISIDITVPDTITFRNIHGRAQQWTKITNITIM